MPKVTDSPDICACCCRAAANNAPAMVEVARLQAETILALTQRNNPNPNPVNCHSPPATEYRSVVHSIHTDIPTGLLIGSSTGSISIADWDAMSDARLRNLDTALKKIVETAMIESISWKNVGLIIQRELAVVGFVFSTVCDSTMYHETGGWKEAENKALSDLVRVRAARRAAGTVFGEAMWVEEMLRIAVRLMELRGM